MGFLVTICDLQIAAKQKASYDIKMDTTIMTSQLLGSYITDPCYASCYA